MADNLQTALQNRAVIDQAKGILMERHKMTADQAFQVLAGVDVHHRKLRSVADDLVRTGELPPEEPAGTGELPGGRHPRPSVRMSGPAGRRAARPTAEDRGHRTVEW
jgi:hypothetical protein